MARAQRHRAESKDRQRFTVGGEDGLYESFLNPLTSSLEAQFCEDTGRITRRTWHQKKTQEGCKASVGGAAQKADERRLNDKHSYLMCTSHRSPELRPPSLQLEVKRPTRHR